MKLPFLLLLCLSGCATTVEKWHYATPAEIQAESNQVNALRAQLYSGYHPEQSMPPLPPTPPPARRKSVRSEAPEATPNWPWSGPYNATNYPANFVQVWIGVTNGPGFPRNWVREYTNTARVAVVSGPHCFQDFLVPPDPQFPGTYEETAWNHIPVGTVEVQVTTDLRVPQWTTIGTLQWTDPNGVLGVGRLATGSTAGPDAPREFMRLKVTP